MSEFLRRQSRAIWLSIFLITVARLVAATRLPVTLFPHIDYPRVVVSIDAGERDPTQMAAEITRPAEVALRQVPGVKHLRSTTSRGNDGGRAKLRLGQDLVAATLATQGELATLLPDLPLGTRFTVRRSDPTIFLVYGLSLTSAKRSPVELQQIAQLRLRPLLSTVMGVRDCFSAFFKKTPETQCPLKTESTPPSLQPRLELAPGREQHCHSLCQARTV